MPIAPARRVLGTLMTLAVFGAAASAARPAAQVLPAETVGYFSAANAPDLAARWEKTQLGKLAADPSMRPFLDQVRERMNREFGELESRLGVTLDDLRAAASGEAAVGVVKTDNPERPGLVSALVDTTGRDAEAKQLLAKIDACLSERSAKRTQSGVITEYKLPADEEKNLPARTVAVFYAEEMIGAAEGETLAAELLARLSGDGAGQTLADAPAFAETQRRARAQAGGSPSVAWFLSPFEYQAATRQAPSDEALPEGKDTLAILAEQGFDAIKGIGGVVTVAATPERDFVHHTFIYAPPKPGTADKPVAERYNLAMRMADLPNNSGDLNPSNPPVQAWAPRQVANYQVLNLATQNAFEHLGTLFDSFAGYEGAFDTTLRGLEKDPYGPKIRVREDVIANLGDRVTVMTDYTLPITPECERYLFVVDVTNEQALREPLFRWLESDDAVRKELEGVEYWELIPESELDSADGFDTLDPLDPLEPLDGSAAKDEPERMLRRAAVCLHESRLLISSDADFLRQALFGASPGASLGGSADLQATLAAVADVSPQGPRCAWVFSRLDEALRPTYELIRAGQMPQGQTFFARLLNRLLTTESQREVDALREQKIDGRKLPTFELARRYFGPSGRSVRSEADGWLISGVLLSKEPTPGPAASVARK